jgi:prolyl-tRNA synthetase
LTQRPGFIGPQGIKNVKVIADLSVKDLKNFVVGINETDYHLVGANFGQEITMPELCVDVRLAKAGEGCSECNGTLLITKGIEVGNIFQLGTKYSKAMNATFTDVDGTEKPFIMGCYGIGITRTAASAIERYHDEWGIIWPLAIAPYHVVVTPVNVKDEQQMGVAQQIYDELKKQGVEVVLDDRDERAGVKFKDADLIGFPYRITVGKTISEGQIEFKARAGGDVEKMTPEDAVAKIVDVVKAIN